MGGFLGVAQGQSIAGFRITDDAGRPVSELVRSSLAGLPGADGGSEREFNQSILSLSAPDGASLRLVVLSDQTKREVIVHEELLRSFIALAFLTLCSFGVPAFVVEPLPNQRK